jgi:hypothetical protein
LLLNRPLNQSCKMFQIFHDPDSNRITVKTCANFVTQLWTGWIYYHSNADTIGIGPQFADWSGNMDILSTFLKSMILSLSTVRYMKHLQTMGISRVSYYLNVPRIFSHPASGKIKKCNHVGTSILGTLPSLEIWFSFHNFITLIVRFITYSIIEPIMYCRLLL